jgi:Xaa-Pro aminopeptidase
MKTDFFRRNRDALQRAVRGGVVVLSAYSSQQKSNDAAHTFEQEANFWYVSGINQAEWSLVIDGARERSYLVAPEISSQKAIFDGSLSWDDAQKISGVDEVIAADKFDELLRELAKKHSLVYTLGDDPHAKYYDFVVNPAQKQLNRRLERVFADVQDCRKELARLRAIKQPDEIKAIKSAAVLTVKAFEAVKQKFDTYRYEYQIEADFTHYFRSRGAAGHAYDPIIAGGANACTLHYNQNQTKLRANQLVLMDVGARVDGYAADVTRTYRHGSLTKRQRAIHQAVEAAHHDIIAFIKPGLPIEQYLRDVDTRMKAALMEVGLMKHMDDEVYRTYFPHAISHGLGIDVHDSLGGSRVFEPGMVLTVEPGIYIPKEGIGVRIEDDIIITEKGRQNITGNLSTEC